MKLKDKVQHALDESRMLVMGVQVLLGFNFQAFLMRRFERMPAAAHDAKLVSTALLLLATLLLMAPASRHRLVERGRDTQSLHAFARRMSSAALVPFALSLGIDFFIVVCRAVTPAAGALAGVLAASAALLAWYALPRWSRHDTAPHSKEADMESPSLNDKIKQVMVEVRVVLPGTQALLGFQFAAVLQDGFDDLPPAHRLVHVGGLACLGISVVLLMLPAAFHRIAERGELSDRLHRLSSASLLLGMLALAAGLGCDTFIVVAKALGSARLGLAAASAWLIAASALWFAYPFFKKRAVSSVATLPASVDV